jgi:hypothetical protein
VTGGGGFEGDVPNDRCRFVGRICVLCAKWSSEEGNKGPKASRVLILVVVLMDLQSICFVRRLRVKYLKILKSFLRSSSYVGRPPGGIDHTVAPPSSHKGAKVIGRVIEGDVFANGILKKWVMFGCEV